MKTLRKLTSSFILFGLVFFGGTAIAQTDTTAEEEDWSIYDNLEFADAAAKRFCSNKISGLSPSKLISIGYDFQGGYDLTAGGFGNVTQATERVNATHGLRAFANVPVYSRNSIIVQVGANYIDSRYQFENDPSTAADHPLHRVLNQDGLRSAGLNTTVFKPLNEEQFLIFQASADLNGDYSWSSPQSLDYLRYSAAALWGKRVSDFKQWAIGLSRTYLAGEQNVVPIFLFNWTSLSRKWGTEILAPARAHVRYSFNPRNLLFFGYQLEGASYRIGNEQPNLWGFNNLEIRRSELRFRFIYERQLKGFVWVSAQAGYRVNYLYDVDSVPNGDDFFRGFFGDQPYVMENDLTNPLYFNISLNLVSP